MGSGSGDIWVGGGNRNKKPLIIGLVILAAVAIIGVIIALIISSASGNNAQGAAPVESFNRYANYLLFGETKDEAPAGEFELDATYEIDRQLSGGTVDEKYWTTAQDLLSHAVSQYHDTENPVNPDMGSVLDDYQQTFAFIYLYRQTGDIDEDSIVSTYNNSGASAAESAVESFYQTFSNSDSTPAKNYAEQRIAEYSAMVKLYQIYDSLGCINESGEMSELACTEVPSAAAAEEALALSETISEAKARADQTLRQAIRGLKDNCWRIGLQLQTAPEEIPPEDDEGDEE